MNVLPLEKQAQILSALVEGNSVRSTSRMSVAHVGTILNLLVRVGNGCSTLMDQTMHGLRCQRLEVDEIWAYVGMKQGQAAAHPERRAQIGEFYTFVALDAETKLVPCFRVGKRTWNETDAFIGDLKSRLTTRIQLTSILWRGKSRVRKSRRLCSTPESIRIRGKLGAVLPAPDGQRN
jgi:hypothetical protein